MLKNTPKLCLRAFEFIKNINRCLCSNAGKSMNCAEERNYYAMRKKSKFHIRNFFNLRVGAHAGKMRTSDKLKAIAAATLAGAFLAGAILTVSPGSQADAATAGNGYTRGGIHLGGWIIGAESGYCVQPSFPDPTAAQQSPTEVGTIPGGSVPAWVGSWSGTVSWDQLSGDPVGQVSRIDKAYSSHPDRDWSAAGQVAIWKLQNTTLAWMQAIVAEVGADWGTISGLADQVIALTAAPTATAPTDHVTMTRPDFNDPYIYQIVIPSGWSVSLENGIFTANGTPAMPTPGTYEVRLNAPDNAVDAYIKWNATTTLNSVGANNTVWLHPSTNPNQQVLGTPAGGQQIVNESGDMMDPLGLQFSPIATTNVPTKYLNPGEKIGDVLKPGLAPGSPAWRQFRSGKYLETVWDITGYRFDQPHPEGTPIPAGTPEVAHLQVTTNATDGPNTTYPVEFTAEDKSGFYTWVAKFSWDNQPALTKTPTLDGVPESTRIPLGYNWEDTHWLVNETQFMRFQPEGTSKVVDRLSTPGAPLVDTLSVFSKTGWPLEADGTDIDAIFTVTAFRADNDLPPTEGTQLSADKIIGQADVVASGPGDITSPPFASDAAFINFVWTFDRAKQANPDLFIDDWKDTPGLHEETTSVRHPLTITSEVKEYNVHPGGRAFDTITVAGFPSNHGDFKGDGFWKADNDQVEHTTYGPFASDALLVDTLDLSTAPVLKKITTPAKNGVYKVGYTDADKIQPEAGGWYVVVSSFAGDDRVQPFTSSPADILERFFVPGTTPPTPLGEDPKVVTQAKPAAGVGEEFYDTALVTGDVPAGSTLTFEAFGPTAPGEPPVCDVAFFTSDAVTVSGAGFYQSGKTKVTTAGNVWWIETLRRPDGEIIHRGKCGAPGELTVVTATPVTPPAAAAAPKLATTGSGNLGLGLGLGAAILSLLGGTALTLRRRKVSA